MSRADTVGMYYAWCNTLDVLYSGDIVLHLTLIDMSDSHRCAVHTQCQISPHTFTSEFPSFYEFYVELVMTRLSEVSNCLSQNPNLEDMLEKVHI